VRGRIRGRQGPLLVKPATGPNISGERCLVMRGVTVFLRGYLEACSERVEKGETLALRVGGPHRAVVTISPAQAVLTWSVIASLDYGSR
jgi:hypothetical protein